MNIFESKINLRLFADAGTLTNVTSNYTTGPVNSYNGSYYAGMAGNDANGVPKNSMSSTMKTYYDTELLENARPKLIFSQLGKQQNLPANRGETVEWRKWNTFEKSLTPLQEGVIPAGKPFGQTAINVTVRQYGDYTSISDRLDLHAVDNVILGATEEMGAAGGETADTLVRNELCTGTNVMYADTLSSGVYQSTPVGRYQMAAANNRLTPDMVNKAFTWLKKQKAPFYEGNKYLAVIHPSVAYDLRSSPEWIEAHKYDATREIFEGEIGELHGVRFVESTEAPIFNGGTLFTDAQRYLTFAAYSGTDTTASAGAGVTSAYKITVAETLTEAIGKALVGRKIHVYDTSATALAETLTIVGCTYGSKYIWVDRAPTTTLSAASGSEDKFYPGEGGNSTSGPCAVYGTMFFGKDAFAVVDPQGMGMEMIVKDASQIGGPLNQFSTVGYKFENAAKILYQNRMVRVESCSAYSTVDEAN